jgi:hypothetical protein
VRENNSQSIERIARQAFGADLLRSGFVTEGDAYVKRSEIGDAICVRARRQHLVEVPYVIFDVQLYADVAPYIQFSSGRASGELNDTSGLGLPGLIRRFVAPGPAGLSEVQMTDLAMFPRLWAHDSRDGGEEDFSALRSAVLDEIDEFRRFLDRENYIEYVQEAFDQWDLSALEISPGRSLPFALAGSAHTVRYRESLEWVRRGNAPDDPLLAWLMEHYPA